MFLMFLCGSNTWIRKYFQLNIDSFLDIIYSSVIILVKTYAGKD